MKENPVSKSQRNYGIDLLRIVSMLMITIVHVVGTGGIISAKMTPLNASISWTIRSMTFCAVNCYALISGYVGINSKQKLSSLADLWARVAFYSVAISTILYFVRPDIAPLGTIFKSFFPVINNQYWYFTAYFGMWFFAPLVNAAVDNLPKQKLGLIIIGSFILMTPGNIVNNSFQFDEGYSVAWLLFLYLVGAYIGKHNLFKSVSKGKAMLVYLISVTVTTVLKLTLAFDSWNFYGYMMLNYTSPTMVVCAVSLLALFCNINCSNLAKKIIGFFAPLSFSVYLIHTHPIFFGQIFSGKFSFLAEKSPLILVSGIILSTLAIYFVSVFIDYFRHLLFKLLRVKKILMFAENKLSDAFNKITKKGNN